MKTQKLRAAHASVKDGRVIVIAGFRTFQTEEGRARVIFTSTRLESPKVKATIASSHALLEGKRAA